MDEATRAALERRAYAIWQEAGCPEGQALLHWLQAELEFGVIAKVEPDDPFVTLHELGLVVRDGAGGNQEPSGDPNMQADKRDEPVPTDEALRHNVERVVPQAEQLPRASDENPVSEQVERVARGGPSRPGAATVQGGERVPGTDRGPGRD